MYRRANQLYTTQLLPPPTACYLLLSTKSVATFERLELFFRSLGEARALTESSSNEEISEEAELKVLHDVLEVALFNEFPEAMPTTTATTTASVSASALTAASK